MDKETGTSDYQKLLALLTDLSATERKTINVYHRIQEAAGYVPREVLQEIARKNQRSEAEEQGLLSFFDSFRTRPPAEHTVAVCYGTACYAQGAAVIYDRIALELNLDEEGYSPDGTVNVEKVFCIGACSQAPLIVRNNKIQGNIKAHEVPNLVFDLKEKNRV